MDEFTEKLTRIFLLINDWLKYAEAKNAFMLAFSGAGITATVTYLSTASSGNPPKSLWIGIIIATCFLCLTSLICATSFLPKTNLEYIVWRKAKPSNKSKDLPQDTDNLYYFKHLFKYKPEELIEALNHFYFDDKFSIQGKKEYLDIANQIVINSEITLLKFKMFTFSLWSLIVAIVVTPITVLVSLIVFHAI
jgi:hypothetical protein